MRHTPSDSVRGKPETGKEGRGVEQRRNRQTQVWTRSSSFFLKCLLPPMLGCVCGKAECVSRSRFRSVECLTSGRRAKFEKRRGPDRKTVRAERERDLSRL